jgi:hypothetical protein
MRKKKKSIWPFGRKLWFQPPWWLWLPMFTFTRPLRLGFTLLALYMKFWQVYGSYNI